MKKLWMIILAISAFALTACAEPETTTDDTNNNNRETITEVNDMANTNAYNQISQEEAKQMMTLDDGHVIVDVRRADEYKEGHIPGAILIPNESISSEQPKELPDLEQIILVYCRSGRRSKEAAEKLANIGYTNVYEFGGIIDWTGDIEK